MTQPTLARLAELDLSLIEAATLLYAVRVPACLGAVIGIGLALLWLRATPPEFTARVLIAPSLTTAEALLNPTAPTLPTQAGIETGDAAAVSNLEEFLERVTSVQMARRLVGDETLYRAVLRAEWDEARGVWRPQPGLTARTKRALLTLSGRDPWHSPGPEDFAGTLRRDLRISHRQNLAMRQLAYRHPDREVATAVLHTLVMRTDDHLRSVAAARIDGHRTYLQAHIDGMSDRAHRAALVRLHQDLTQADLLLQEGQPYAVRFIDPPWAPIQPDWPNPVFVLPVGGIVGIMMGVAAGGLWRLWRMPTAGRNPASTDPASLAVASPATPSPATPSVIAKAVAEAGDD